MVYDSHQNNDSATRIYANGTFYNAADGEADETDRYESRQGLREERSNFELSTKRIL